MTVAEWLGQWAGPIGIILDLSGFLLIGWEYFRASAAAQAKEKESANLGAIAAEGVRSIGTLPINDQEFVQDQLKQVLSRHFEGDQKSALTGLRETLTRSRIFKAAAFLVIMGFILQLLGSWPAMQRYGRSIEKSMAAFSTTGPSSIGRFSGVAPCQRRFYFFLLRHSFSEGMQIAEKFWKALSIVL